MYCAANPDRPSKVAEIAASFGMSETHLFKIMKILVDADLIKTLRGRNGGIVLARPANKITLGEVVRVAEESFYLAECFNSGRKDCPILTTCGFNGVLHEALEAFMDVLDSKTIEDISENHTDLRQLLNIGEISLAAAS